MNHVGITTGKKIYFYIETILRALYQIYLIIYLFLLLMLQIIYNHEMKCTMYIVIHDYRSPHDRVYRVDKK